MSAYFVLELEITNPAAMQSGSLADQASSPLEAWRPWADQVSDLVLDCGHFLAEEEPAACADALTRFFATPPAVG